MSQIAIKPWGSETLEFVGPYVVKKIYMRKGERCSLQRHLYKTETISVVFGPMTVTINGVDEDYVAGESVTIPAKVPHRMTAKYCDCTYIECSTPHLDDVIRLEDDYGRIS